MKYETNDEHEMRSLAFVNKTLNGDIKKCMPLKMPTNLKIYKQDPS